MLLQYLRLMRGSPCCRACAVSGKQVTFFSMPDDVFLQALTPFVGDKMANGLLAMYVGVRENGRECQ